MNSPAKKDLLELTFTIKEAGLEISSREIPSENGKGLMSELIKSFETHTENIFFLLKEVGILKADENSFPLFDASELEERLYDGIAALVYETFKIGQFDRAASASLLAAIDKLNVMEVARLTLPRSGRQAQYAAQMKKRAEVEAAIRSMSTFAKSDVHAKKAAKVVLEKTGYKIPWQTIKSSYLFENGSPRNQRCSLSRYTQNEGAA